MVTVEITGHLLQRKLENSLKSIVGEDAWNGREVKVPNSRRRWDMAYEIDNKVTIVEFDGDAHYRDPLKIKVDHEKDIVANDLGYQVIRVPYWVQLTNETLDFYFCLKANVIQDFPHGFITTKLFPASYCEMGIKRFEEELYSLPGLVRNAVIKSLGERAEEHGKEYVLPKKLQSII